MVAPLSFGVFPLGLAGSPDGLLVLMSCMNVSGNRSGRLSRAPRLVSIC
jgi:hypothetical protein